MITQTVLITGATDGLGNRAIAVLGRSLPGCMDRIMRRAILDKLAKA